MRDHRSGESYLKLIRFREIRNQIYIDRDHDQYRPLDVRKGLNFDNKIKELLHA